MCSPAWLVLGAAFQALMALAAVITTHHAVSLIVLVVLPLQMLLTKGSRQACSAPKTVENTVFPENQSYAANEHFRYACKDGYKRQAGTSNLAICFLNTNIMKLEWKYGNISCIQDPSSQNIPASVTNTPPTTLGSSPSSVSTVSSTCVETQGLTTPAAKTPETPTSKAKVTQLPHDSGLTPTRCHTTSGQPTDFPGSNPSHASPSSSTQIKTFTANVSTSTEQIHETFTSNSKTTQLTQDPGQTPTIKQTTTYDHTTQEQTTDSPEPMGQQAKTISVGISGAFIFLTVVVLLIALIIRRRNRHSQPYTADIHVPLQHSNIHDSSSAPHLTENEEESGFL